MNIQNQNPKYITCFFIIVILFSFLTYSHDSLKMLKESNFADFGNYYFYATVMRNGYNLYELTPEKEKQLAEDMHMPKFVGGGNYGPPSLLFPIIPLTFLKHRIAASIWHILNDILLIWAVLMIVMLAKEKISFKPSIIAVIFMVFFFQPLIEEAWLGNCNLTMLFFLVTSVVFLKINKPILSGIMLAIVIISKHQYGLLLFFFLWKREYRVFVSAILAMLILVLLSIFILGLPLHLSYLEVFQSLLAEGHSQMLNMWNLSLYPFLYRLFGVTNLGTDKYNLIKTIGTIFSLLFLFYTIYVTRGKRKISEPLFTLEFSLVLILILIISPIVHEPHYVLLYMPIILFWYNLEVFKDEKLPWILFVVSFLLIALRYSLNRFPIFHTGILSLFFNGKLYGTILLYILGVKIIKKQQSLIANNMEVH